MATHDTTTPNNVVLFPKGSPPNPLSPPRVAEILDRSPSVQERGALTVAWHLVADMTATSGSDLVLALAIGAICRELAALKSEDAEVLS